MNGETRNDYIIQEPVIVMPDYNFINDHLQYYILKASDSSGVDPYLIDAVIFVESGGNVNAISPTKVRGAMQVTKKTATIYGLNPYDIYDNILAGSLYLRDMIQEFNDTTLALAAYNKGPAYVKNNLDLITFRYSEKVNRVYEANKEL
jgi:soluble lytic murein transglycosylase-like protein